MNKTLFSIIILLIILPFVSANTEFLEYGFGIKPVGFGYAATNVWGSPLNAGSFPSQNLSIIVKSIRLPMVTDLNIDNVNEIYFFALTGIYYYDNNGFLSSSYSPSGGIKGRFDKINYEDDYDYELAGLTNLSGNIKLVYLQKNGGSIEPEVSFDITDRDYVNDTFCGNDFCFIPERFNNFAMVDIQTGAETYILSNMNSTGEDMYKSTGTDYQGYAIAGDVDSDGNDEFIQVANCRSPVGWSTNCSCASIYDSVNGWEVANKPLFADELGTCKIGFHDSANKGTGLQLTIGKLGQTGAYIYAVSMRYETSTRHRLYNSQFDAILTKSGGDPIASTVVIADIDEDGNNEACFLAGQAIECYDTALALKYTIKTLVSPLDNMQMIFAELNTTNNFLELIMNGGIYNLNMSGTGVNRTYGIPINSFTAIPVPIRSRTNGVIDLLALGTLAGTTSTLMFSSPLIATCGNNVCESGENSLNCIEDCVITLPTQALATEITVNPCFNQVWKTNTSVGVTVKVETIDGGKVQARVILYEGLSAAQDSGWTSLLTTGSIFSFIFRANQTVNDGLLNIYSRSENNQLQTSITYNIDVSDTGDIEFGDSECGTEQPLSEITFPANATTDIDENFLSQGMKEFSAYTKLGLNILTFFVLIFVTVAIFFVGSKNNYSSGVIGGSILLVDSFIVLIAVNLGWINVGIVITLAIVGLIALALMVNRWIHPAN